MDSASPTASASTNRGGRPKDWTEPRTRRLIRLYLFTTLPLHKILELLEEDDFKPGKDAANKVKNTVLGNDPRWIRPRDDNEEKARIRGLRNSLRGRRGRQNVASQGPSGTAPGHNINQGTFSEDRSLGGTTITQSYRSSFEESHWPDSASFAHPLTTNNTYSMALDEVTSSRFIPSLIGRRNSNRQDTGLTASTDISITSALREKLSFLSLSKAKRTFKVLKRYTFPKNLESQHTFDISHGPEHLSSDGGKSRPLDATFAIPGDFLNFELFANRSRCATESLAHAAGTCWCKVDDQVGPTRKMWANTKVSGHISDQGLMLIDSFGNTVFHYLASLDGIQDLFIHLVSQAPREPRLPFGASNTAGQTFLHVLHHSWFREGSRLTELLDTLRAQNFDIFATDVYGRNFYHTLRHNRKNSARFPGQTADISRINRRDAFGLKPMDPYPARDNTYTTTHTQVTQGANTSIAPGLSRPTPKINTQAAMIEDKEIYMHVDLLKVVVKAVGVDEDFAPNPQNEDSQGRNGFHCLAEIDFGLAPATPKHNARAYPIDESRLSPPGQSKRRYDDSEEIEVPRTVSDSRRLECIRGLILAKVDANQYDINGNTPLMSFVLHSSDATKYEKEESETVLRTLVHSAGARLEARNRSGETALHLAARHGKTVALRVLLELGANPNTRNGQGLSILEVIDNLYLTTERDDKHNARFEACRAILTRTPDATKQSPNLLDEWGKK
ncbi:hypothetical protein F5B22DRAFT_80838 [Xylaria bambusicola]|uniref:uncharacterized protein n=1 Tax=Xylaria bambusicola TaxID=326684 RepID=UPI002008B2A0|nr:uncharacterized protein F5B22DRAFT_80838 [Xylaria bambusicola]KAI0518322.1 hypothetical protein F5B22DRAFT_80838 [Xylaria bambusicola]